MKLYNFSFGKNRFASKLLTALCLSGFVLSSSSAHSNEDLEGAPVAKRMRSSGTYLLPAEIWMDCIVPFLTPYRLLRFEEVSPFLKVKEEHWQALIQRQLPAYKNIALEIYPDHLLSYKFLNFLAHKFEKITALDQIKEFIEEGGRLKLIPRTFSPLKVTYLKGLVAEMTGNEGAAWKYYQEAEEGGFLKAKQRINSALYNGLLGQHIVGQAKRFQLLLTRAESGDPEAQQYISDAINSGTLGQNAVSPEERFHALLRRADAGDQKAKQYVYHAMLYGTLGQNVIPKEERFEDLSKRAEAGDLEARKYVFKSIYYGIFPYSMEEKEKFKRFLEEANAGNLEAQTAINNAIVNRTMGQGDTSQEERFKILLSRAQAGDPIAKEMVNNIIYKGDLEQYKVSPEARFRYLEESANLGDLHAQSLIDKAIEEGDFRYESYSVEKRFKTLQARADAGDKVALEKVYNAIWEGKLAHKPYMQIKKVEKIFQKACLGDLTAQKVLMSKVEGKEPAASVKVLNLFFSLVNELFSYEK